MKFEIKLINIGRDKYNRTRVVNTKDIHGAERIAIKEIKLHVLSQHIELVPQHGSYGYMVIAGFQKIGDVKIYHINKMPKGLTKWEQENWKESH